MIRIGRYFDRDASDPSGLTFEEWQPELVFTLEDVGSKVSISRQGHINVHGRLSRPDVYWDDVTPPMLAGVTILSVSDGWAHYGTGRNDKFRNPRSAGGFVINSTELRAINFSMEALDRPAVQPRRGGRRAAVLSAPLPKRYRMHPEIDAMIRARCW
ncbi:hypothetical protein AB1Y20_006214 [Prymnesium parvum]|uniref:Uncharacterized protein n=1 Tax=Prymnesium parvum TaxID=97485 RepID=A0AB34J230_PRYPA